MPSPKYRVILPVALGQQVEALAMESGQGISGVIRKCVELAVFSPELRVLLYAEGPPVTEDTRTEAQRQRAEVYLKSLESVDLATLIAGMID
jgi:hypothetical protein